MFTINSPSTQNIIKNIYKLCINKRIIYCFRGKLLGKIFIKIGCDLLRVCGTVKSTKMQNLSVYFCSRPIRTEVLKTTTSVEVH